MSKHTIILMSLIVISTAFMGFWVGWYATAIGLGILGIWFGIILWQVAELDAKVLMLITIEVILVWLAFGLAYLEMGISLSSAFSLSMQNLMHFDFIDLPNGLSELWYFRLITALEGFVGYLLVVSGIALLISDKVNKRPAKSISI